MEFINMFDKWINERVAKAVEEQAKIHERDAERIATLERRLSQIDTDLMGVDEQNGYHAGRLDEMEYEVSTLEDRITQLEEVDGDAQVKVRRYIREYFDSARIKVMIDKEVI
jgi:septal ring factor EnvC (AmiA/AmiB activator)